MVGDPIEMPEQTNFNSPKGILRPAFALGLLLFGGAVGPIRGQATPSPAHESSPDGAVVLLPASGDAPLGTAAESVHGHPAVEPEEIPTPAALDTAGWPADSAGPEPAVLSGCAPNLPDDPELSRKSLLIPVLGVVRSQLRDSFVQRRSGGRTHHAIDIMAPRNTPILAIEDGTIVKLTNNRLGGITLYQLDPTGNYAYYYAHLERYAPGLAAGQQVQRGQVIGYVGTSGNAPRNSPHLHFAVYRLPQERAGWIGRPINPYDVLSSKCRPESARPQLANDDESKLPGTTEYDLAAAAAALALVAPP